MAQLDSINVPWQTDPPLGSMPESFKLIQENFLRALDLTVTNSKREPESAEYGAVQFDIGGRKYLFCQAKHTPKKIGQFVTLWKRPTTNSEIAPFDKDDGFDGVIVLVDEESRFGVFVFQNQLLVKKDIFSEHGEGGKRAFRVYAPWTIPIAAQAKRSKEWQCTRFVELTNTAFGLSQLRKLFP